METVQVVFNVDEVLPLKSMSTVYDQYTSLQQGFLLNHSLFQE